MASYSYTPDYFSLSDILATEERVPMVAKADLPQLGFLDHVNFINSTKVFRTCTDSPSLNDGFPIPGSD
jgi:hypothetical protein